MLLSSYRVQFQQYHFNHSDGNKIIHRINKQTSYKAKITHGSLLDPQTDKTLQIQKLMKKNLNTPRATQAANEADADAERHDWRRRGPGDSGHNRDDSPEDSALPRGRAAQVSGRGQRQAGQGGPDSARAQVSGVRQPHGRREER